MAAKTIKINVEAKTAIPYDKLEPFQGELKSLAKEEYEKMRANILEHGFSFAVHVWQNDKHNYIIDGHQRIFTITQLATVEGYKIPEIPVALVKAKSFKEAKLKVLAGASQYGRVSDVGLHAFMQANDISFDDLAATFDFPEIDLGEFSDQFYKIEQGDQLPPTNDPEAGEMQSSSADVKQVQLLFNSTSHEEFMKNINALATKYKTQNITDTVVEALREVTQTRKAKP